MFGHIHAIGMWCLISSMSLLWCLLLKPKVMSGAVNHTFSIPSQLVSIDISEHVVNLIKFMFSDSFKLFFCALLAHFCLPGTKCLLRAHGRVTTLLGLSVEDCLLEGATAVSDGLTNENFFDLDIFTKCSENW